MANLILEQNLNRMINESVDLGRTKYAEYINSAENAFYESTGKKMGSNIVSSLVKTLSATSDYLRESTMPGDTNAFINHAFDMITAILPSSIIEEFATIQGMEKRVGEVFFMDIKTGTAKGAYTAGGNYLSSQYGPQTGESYSDERVQAETVATTTATDGSDTTFAHVLSWSVPLATTASPITLYYTIGGTDYTATCTNGTTFSGTGISSGTYTASTKTVDLTFSTAPDNGTGITVDYIFNGATSTSSALPEVDVSLTSAVVTAKRRALKTKWLLDTSAMLAKEHGKDIEKELLDSVIAGVMNEIAVEMSNDIWTGANAGTTVEFSKNPPSLAIPYAVHIQNLYSQTIVEADTNIESAVRKVKANFVIGGKEFVRVAKGLPTDLFKPASYSDAVPVNMHVIGTLANQYKVIQNFDMGVNDFVVGAKGNNWLTTGFIYSPFIPIMTSKPVTDENLMTYRSLLTYYGKLMVNSKFFNRGLITA